MPVSDLERVQVSIDAAIEKSTEAIKEWHRAVARADEDEAEEFFEAATTLGQMRTNLRGMVTKLARLANPRP